MLEGMHHVAVIASDEGKALDFYVNKLGFTVEKKPGGQRSRTICECCGWAMW